MRDGMKRLRLVGFVVLALVSLTGCWRKREVEAAINRLVPASSYEVISYQERYETKGQSRTYLIETTIRFKDSVYLSSLDEVGYKRYKPIPFISTQLTLKSRLIRGKGAAPVKILSMEDGGLDFSYLLTGAYQAGQYQRIAYTFNELKAKHGNALLAP